MAVINVDTTHTISNTSFEITNGTSGVDGKNGSDGQIYTYNNIYTGLTFDFSISSGAISLPIGYDFSNPDSPILNNINYGFTKNQPILVAENSGTNYTSLCKVIGYNLENEEGALSLEIIDNYDNLNTTGFSNFTINLTGI